MHNAICTVLCCHYYNTGRGSQRVHGEEGHSPDVGIVYNHCCVLHNEIQSSSMEDAVAKDDEPENNIFPF